MVLPTAAHKATKLPSVAATPDRSLYEAGNGHILSHFADIATPADNNNSNNNRNDPRHARALGAGAARARARRSLDGLNGDAPSAASGRTDDVHMDDSNRNTATKDYSYVGATDRDMEDALFGANNNNNSSEHELLSQQEKLEQWRRNKDRASGTAAAGHRIAAHAGAKASLSVQQQPLKRPKAAHASKMQQHSPPRKPSAASVSTTASTAFAESNQSHESDQPTAQMFSMDFSPPRRSRSSRRATVEVDPSTAAALTSSSSDKV